MSNRILILFAHPALEKSRVNRQLLQAVLDLESVTIHDLYESYPSFHINIRREQELLTSHDIIVFHHPFYWYSSPAILKEWQDLVLEHGFAYGQGGSALRGRRLLSAITTGGSEQTYSRQGYNYFTIRELLTPFEQTAQLCGMEYLPPFVVQGTHQIREQSLISRYAQDYRAVILALRDDRVNWESLKKFNHFNHSLEQVITASEASHHA